MANQKGDTVSTGHFWNRCIDAVNKKFETYSFWHKASDCEFDDGENAQTKVGAIKGITSDLNTTTTGYAADMTTVSKLNSSFGTLSFGVDSDGNAYYKIGGADTEYPFSKTPVITQQSGISQNASQLQICVGDGYTLYENLFYLITNISLVGYNRNAVLFDATYDGANLIITCSSGGQVGSFSAVAFMLN